MLKNRLIPVLFLKHGFLVRSEQFKIHQNLGNPISQVERYNNWDVDELIYIDITSDTTYDRNRDDTGIENPNNILDIIKLVASKCFMPLTFGGKIRKLQDISARMSSGADKVTINSKAIEEPSFITEAAKQFGSQAIIVSIDIFKHENNSYEVFGSSGFQATGMDPVDWAHEVEDKGAGEIFLNSINHDGMANGYDIEIIRKVVDNTTIPVIACGGVRDFKDFRKGIVEGGATAVAAGNIFHYKEMSYVLAKQQLKKMEINVR